MNKSERDTTIEKYYWFAIKYANKYQNVLKDRDDRVSLAGEALVRAVDTYNSTKGTKLTTHIMNCIRSAMLKEQQKSRRMCRDATVMSMDARLPFDDGDTFSLHDVLPSDAVNPVEWAIQREACNEVREAYRSVSDKQKLVLFERYVQNDGMTLDEIGKKHNRTKQWAASLERRGLNNMRNYIETLHKNGPTFGVARGIV